MPKQTTTKVLTVKPWQWVWVSGPAEMHPKPKRRGEMRVAVVAERAVRIELRPRLKNSQNNSQDAIDPADI